MPNDKDGKRSRVKISTGELLGGLENLCMHARVRQIFDHHRIARDRTVTTIRSNDEDSKQLRAKISTIELSGGPRNLHTRERKLNI